MYVCSHEHFSSLAALGGEEWASSSSSLAEDASGRNLGASGARAGATSRAARARAARLHHIVGRFNEWLRTGGKRGGGLVRGGVVASVIDPTQVAAGTDARAAYSEGRLVAVAEHGLREAEMVAVSMSAVMSAVRCMHRKNWCGLLSARGGSDALVAVAVRGGALTAWCV